VTVLERDAVPLPEDPSRAWDTWQRAGVAQFRQPHNLFPPFRHIVEDELPGTVDDLVDAGCVLLDPLEWMPPFIHDRAPRTGDDRFRYVTGRRPVVEWVLARRAERQDGVTVRRGVTAAGLVTAASALEGVPHVTGVLTTTGERLQGELVVDAMGRRSPMSRWLAHLGARPPDVEAEEWRFVYHTRYFRGADLPRMMAPPVSELGTISLLTLPGDNGTWSVTVWAASSDTALRGLRNWTRFSAVVGACPLHAHWLRGDPITGMLTMAGSLDRYHRFVVDDRPVATGVASVGDAWACTNPSAGRGMTVGLIHARRLRDVVASGLQDTVAFARSWDEVTEAEVAPFYWDQVEADRARAAQMDALRRGEDPPPSDPTTATLAAAAIRDPVVFRGVLEMAMCLALPANVLARPEIRTRLEGVDPLDGLQLPGPDRSELLELVA
jgi:2-polyprenyl-6-methoxyphenol hydroxylase-like FAD-dependent oxidoreductase